VQHERSTYRPNGRPHWGRVGIQICRDLAGDRYQAKHAALWVVATMVETDAADWEKRQFTRAAYQTCTARDWQGLYSRIEQIGNGRNESVTH